MEINIQFDLLQKRLHGGDWLFDEGDLYTDLAVFEFL